MAEENKSSNTKKRETQRIAWAFTVHALGLDDSSDIFDRAAILLDLERWPEVRYMLVGFETCPNTGRDHLQCYLQMRTKKRFKQIKQLFTDAGLADAHIEPAHGTPAENRAYCTKTKFFEEWGKVLRMGQRSDLEIITEDIIDGFYPSLRAVALQNPVAYVRYHHGIGKLWSFAVEQKNRQPPLVYTFCGPSGVGKTTGCRFFLQKILKIPPEDIYEYCDDPAGPWWPGYHGQTTVVFEDFRGNYPLNSLLRILDTSIVNVPLKGASCPLKAELFCFTANSPLRDYYAMDLQHDAWVRRLDEFSVDMPPRPPKPADEDYVNVETNRLAMQVCLNMYQAQI